MSGQRSGYAIWLVLRARPLARCWSGASRCRGLRSLIAGMAVVVLAGIATPAARAQGLPPTGTVQLLPTQGSAWSGVATLEASGNRTNVSVSLTGSGPGSPFVGRIQAGSCTSSGAIAAVLGTTARAADGTEHLSATVDVPLEVLADGNHVLILDAATRARAACGAIPGAPVQARLPRTGHRPSEAVPFALLGVIMLGAGTCACALGSQRALCALRRRGAGTRQ